MRRSARLALAASLLLVVGGVAGALLWYEQQPPPPAAGTVRLAYPDRNLPPPYETVRTADGRGVSLSFGGLDSGGASLAAQPWPRRNGEPVTLFHLEQGQGRPIDGVIVRAVRIWRTPNSAHEAIDVAAS